MILLVCLNYIGKFFDRNTFLIITDQWLGLLTAGDQVNDVRVDCVVAKELKICEIVRNFKIKKKLSKSLS